MKIDSYTIAKLVGVSQATVSRAFSRPEKVSQETRKKIMETAESLGYKLDKNASALRKKGTNTILLLYLKRDDGHYWTNVKRNFWIFSEAVLSLTSYFESQPYFFEVKQINSIFGLKGNEIKSHCDGVLIYDFLTEEEARFIESWGIPYMICHRAVHLKDFNYSATDNFQGGVIQGEYLKSQGCRNPVYIMNREDPFSHPLRLKGFISVFPESRIIDGEGMEEKIRCILLRHRENQLDGIGFVNDMTLVQTVTGIYRSGIDLMQEYPLIGYDNSTELQVLNSKPATLDIGIGRIYRNGAAALIRLIQKREERINLIHAPNLVPENKSMGESLSEES